MPSKIKAHLYHAEYYKEVLRKLDELYLKGDVYTTQAISLMNLDWENIQTGQKWAEINAYRNEEAVKLCAAYPNVGSYLLNLRQHPRELYVLRAFGTKLAFS